VCVEAVGGREVNFLDQLDSILETLTFSLHIDLKIFFARLARDVTFRQ